MTVAIVDYGSGNLNSAAKAFERAARETGSDEPIVVTDDPDVVARADRVVLPGVGAFADCRCGFVCFFGMVDVLSDAVVQRGHPFLGFCVCLLLLVLCGFVFVFTHGLNWIPGDVRPVRPSDPSLKIPHMGWNTLHPQRDHVLTDGLDLGPEGLHAYFVHSYALEPRDQEQVVAVSSYGGPVTAIVARGNMAGTQFHPEKSQTLGLKLIANFLRWAP